MNGKAPAYTAFLPPILAKRRVLTPYTLPRQHAIQRKTRPNQATANTDLSRIGGSPLEYTAVTPSTSRWAA